MGIRRRTIGALLSGLGEGGMNLAQMFAQGIHEDQRIKEERLRQASQQQFDLGKLKIGELNNLTNNLATHPDQTSFFLHTAAANPLLSGADLSPFRAASDAMGQQQLMNTVNNAASPDAMPADLGAALAARTGGNYPSATLGNAAQFGAQADYADVPPALQAILQTATSRLGQLDQSNERKIADLGRSKFAEAQGTTGGTNAANNANFPTTLQQKADTLYTTGPIEADNAGLKTGAEHRAAIAPDIVKGEAGAAGANKAAEARAVLAPDIVKGEAGAAGAKAGAEETAKLNAKASDDKSDPYGRERAKRTTDAIDELLPKVSMLTVGPASLAQVPGSPARDFGAQLNTIKANVAFNELAQMRAASKTGGALGAVSDKEGQLLQSALGALDQGQSPNNLKAQLIKIKASIQRWEDAQQKLGGATGPSRTNIRSIVPIQ